MSIKFNGITYKSVKSLCDSNNFNYENFRFRAKKLEKKTSDLTENEISAILSTPVHPGRSEYAGYQYDGESFRSAEALMIYSKTRVSLSTIKDRIRKLNKAFNELDNAEKEKLLFDSTYPKYTTKIDSMKDSINLLINKYGNKEGQEICSSMIVHDLKGLIS